MVGEENIAFKDLGDLKKLKELNFSWIFFIDKTQKDYKKIAEIRVEKFKTEFESLKELLPDTKVSSEFLDNIAPKRSKGQ